MKKHQILLLGCGYTLQTVASKLVGYSLIATTTSPFKQQLLLQNNNIESIVLNLNKKEDLEKILNDLPNLRIIIDSIPPTKDLIDSKYPSVFPNHIKVIYLSTTGVYGGENGEVIDEDSAVAPKKENSKFRVAIEEQYLDATILRIAAIYGAERGLVQSILSGRYKLIEDGSYWSNRIHVEDLSNLIVQLIKLHLDGYEIPRIINCSDNSPLRSLEAATLVCNKFKLPLPPSISREEAILLGLHTMLSNQQVKSKFLESLIKLEYPSFKFFLEKQ